MILGLIDEAVQGGARQSKACHVLGLDRRTVQRWRGLGIGEDGRTGPRTRPKNSLSPDERRRVIELATSPEFRDSSPKQIVPTLADRGQYIASESTIYRVLRAEKLDARRSTSAAPTKRHRPKEYVATGPNQVWSWDITYLRTRVRGQFFYLYMLLDVWSRKAVGYAVHDAESGELAAEMIEATYAAESVARGAIASDVPMDAPQVLELVFSAGLSTAATTKVVGVRWKNSCRAGFSETQRPPIMAAMSNANPTIDTPVMAPGWTNRSQSPMPRAIGIVMDTEKTPHGDSASALTQIMARTASTIMSMINTPMVTGISRR